MLNLSDYSPTFIGVIGDVHANTRWTLKAVEEISGRLNVLGEPLPRFILQAGDFGFWGDQSGMNFLQQVNLILAAKGAVIAAVPGNHENYDAIETWTRRADTPPGCPNIYILPRGRRWTWHDRTWLALGGAVSPDKAARKPHIDWFPQEMIGYREAAEICAEGTADVMLTHDAPTGVPLKYMDPPPSFWAEADLERSERHRDLMRSIVNEIEPAYFIHGHYHQGSARWREVIMPHAQMKVATLHMDGDPGNWGILNVKTMEWA